MDELKEIPLPAPVSWMPQTPAWYVLGAAVLLLAAWLLYRYLRERRKNRYRRVALAELESIRKSAVSDTSAITRLPELVKRVSFQMAPRAKVASLSGSAWLSFLDASYGGTGFTQGAGQLLPVLSYQGTSKVTPEQVSSLIDLIASWIRRHHAAV